MENLILICLKQNIKKVKFKKMKNIQFRLKKIAKKLRMNQKNKKKKIKNYFKNKFQILYCKVKN